VDREGQEGTSPGVTEGPGEVGCSRNRQPATTDCQPG
jgi:hypothetical protein